MINKEQFGFLRTEIDIRINLRANKNFKKKTIRIIRTIRTIRTISKI